MNISFSDSLNIYNYGYEPYTPIPANFGIFGAGGTLPLNTCSQLPPMPNLGMNGIFGGMNNARFSFTGNPFGMVNFAFPNLFNFSNMTVSSGSSNASSSREWSSNGTYNLSWWKNLGYNEAKGKKLADAAKSLVHSRSQSLCARYVRQAIDKALFNGQSKCPRNDGCNFGNSLAQLSGFKKIDISGKYFNEKDIPPGAIVVYPSKGYSSHPAGHVEISDGNGHGLSDFQSRYLFKNKGARKEPKEIWIPV